MINHKNTGKKERFHQLLMGAVDHELSSPELSEFNQLVESNPDFRREWEQYKKLKEVTQAMKFKSPPTEVWDNYWMNGALPG